MQTIEPCTFYFVRHGQTDANAQGLMCGGEWDIPLNKIGEEQAQTLVDKVDKLNPMATKIFASPMLRAQQTARFLNARLQLPIENADGLKEWCVGDWEHKPWSEVPNPFNTTEDPPNGEARAKFEERVANTVAQCLKKDKNQTVIFVAHGGVGHALLTVLGVDIKRIENCDLYKISADNLKWTMQKLN